MLSAIMLSVIMLSVIMMSIIILDAIMSNVPLIEKCFALARKYKTRVKVGSSLLHDGCHFYSKKLWQRPLIWIPF